MSTFEDKLELVRPSVGGNAQATRKQLLARRGSVEESAGRITIDTLGGRELWLRVTGEVFEQVVRS